ncbi:PLAT domain-containing protein 1-like [Silene latifolia]|uniref:PLAT domain-containing protein 1-like n=1 Tax=Silene latifolia TaxID=37657 RepID=UPI003D770F81
MGNHNNALTALMLFLAFASIAHFNVVEAKICYHYILVKTGNVKSAGTDARVTVKLYDAQGQMIESTNLQKEGTDQGELRLREEPVDGHWPYVREVYYRDPYDYFERDHLDSFTIRSNCHTSKLCKLELSHDNTGTKPGWYVDYLRVQTKYPGDLLAFEDTKFKINQWLAKDEEPNSLSVQKDLCGSSN